MIPHHHHINPTPSPFLHLHTKQNTPFFFSFFLNLPFSNFTSPSFIKITHSNNNKINNNNMENSSSTTQSLVDFWAVISESKRIINAHSRHFLALSVLFILPLSFSLTVFPTLLHTFTSPTPNHIQSLLRFSLNPPPSHLHLRPSLHHTITASTTFTFSLLFSSFTLFFSLLAAASVTFSVYHGFYGRPVKLLSAIRSLARSFLPLLATFITAQIVIFVVCAMFGVFGYLGIKGIVLILGERGISYDSVYSAGFSILGFLLIGLVFVYSSLNWALVIVIVVVESKWGFESLRRSKDLVRGMRWVAFSLSVFFGFFEGMLLWISMVAGVDDYNEGSVSGGWNTWIFVLRIVVTSAVLTLLLLHNVAAMTVLYMYCKALHGELAGEIAHEFAAEYVSLPFDDEKVPHVVCFVH